MAAPVLDALPGFRRCIGIHPAKGQVMAAVEDDYHCMGVLLHHDGRVVTAAESIMERVPWTTCPGAPAVLQATFQGVALGEVAARGEKRANCTHLHDLAVLAAAHAGDDAPTRYDILACDPVDGLSIAEIRRDGEAVLRIEHRSHVMTAPEEIAGASLMKLRDWIESLDEGLREAARLLQWGAILANGRIIPMERQSNASRVPANCYTFQPENKTHAVRVGRIFDFSDDAIAPLDHFDGEAFHSRAI
ncbi:DUF2889 domain-containing protein [Sphingobium sp. H39-3-25]|uniref:DUF2889 domain-containing protein n=1 Tax=Sphingobium arseniciresistens TaxID=3030834 RepID=UPI0023B9128B|nr:DUF2889 domain-containing protein [Sphingobium arseniciresistens]